MTAEWRQRCRGSSCLRWVFAVWWLAHAHWHAQCAAAVDAAVDSVGADNRRTNSTTSMTKTLMTPSSAWRPLAVPSLPACMPVSPRLQLFWHLRRAQSDVAELNWHGLVFDELTNIKAGRAHWSLLTSYAVRRCLL